MLELRKVAAYRNRLAEADRHSSSLALEVAEEYVWVRDDERVPWIYGKVEGYGARTGAPLVKPIKGHLLAPRAAIWPLIEANCHDCGALLRWPVRTLQHQMEILSGCATTTMRPRCGPEALLRVTMITRGHRVCAFTTAM